MSNYENNKKIQYIDFLKLVEIEVLTITSIIAVYYLFIVKSRWSVEIRIQMGKVVPYIPRNITGQGYEIQSIIKWDC